MPCGHDMLTPVYTSLCLTKTVKRTRARPRRNFLFRLAKKVKLRFILFFNSYYRNENYATSRFARTLLKEATKTVRSPSTTDSPACVTLPPKTRAVPKVGVRVG